MLSAKILVILSLQVFAVFGLGNIGLINLPVLNEENLNWPQQKIQTIEYLLNTLSEVGNVTLVGWQQIWNSDGTLSEIRTIELTILKPTPPEINLSVEEVEVVEELPALLDMLDTISSTTGILASGSIQQWSRNGSILTLLEVDPDSIQIEDVDDDLMYWQQNITLSSTAPIGKLVQVLKQQSVLPVGLLQWNIDGSLNLKSSVIVPELLATVIEAENATLSMLESALIGTSKGALLQPDEIPDYVSNYMKQNIPGYIWLAGEDLVSSWVNPGVHLNVEFEMVDIGLSPISLDIIGVTI